MKPLLEVTGLRVGYGAVEVLKGVDLQVPDGSVVALLGPNGVGKTTTLRSIAGELRPRAGHVQLDGAPITGLTPWDVVRRGVTLIPEGRGVFPSLTVSENLQVFADAARATQEQVDRVFELFSRLGERSSQIAGTLSGGEQQMLALSRAFLARPRLLLVDELSSGLAPVVVDMLFDRLRDLREEGATIVLVEQYLSYVTEFVDLCYVMAKGRVVFVGEPAEIADAESFLTVG